MTENEKTFLGVGAEGWTAIWTCALFVATAALFVVTYLLFKIASDEGTKAEDALKSSRSSAAAADKSAKVARDTLIASHRAWIRPEVSLITGLSFVGESANIGVAFNFENLGNAPAQNIQCSAWLLARYNTTDKMREPGLKLTFRHALKCQEAREKRTSDGFMLFPGEVFPTAQKFKEFSILVGMGREEFADATFITQGKKTLILYVGGAVTYRFPSDDEPHQSSFLYELCFKGIPTAFDIATTAYDLEDMSLLGIPEGDGRHAD